MRIRIVLVLGAVALSLAADEPKEVPKDKELASLQGTWKLEGVESNGKAHDVPTKPPRWVIKGNKVFYGGEELAVLKLDGTTNPKTVDLGFLSPKRIHEGIYSVDKDTLKLCVNRRTEGVKERPSDFETEGKEDRRLLFFKRDMPIKGDPTEGLNGFLGIQIKNSEDGKEVVIVDAFEGSPAKKAGLKADDVVLMVGEGKATDLRTTVDLVRQLKAGSTAVIRIRRGDKEQDIKVKVGVMPFLFLD
jgi:uncharacterized protein (TIGR03067 family)